LASRCGRQKSKFFRAFSDIRWNIPAHEIFSSADKQQGITRGSHGFRAPDCTRKAQGRMVDKNGKAIADEVPPQ
jgi:hypothetical protein